MIHIVAGMFRSGTAMMMQSLIAGGMEAAWNPERDKLAQQHSDQDYHPNASGLYEVALREYRRVDFPLMYQGKTIKVLLWGLDGLAVNPEGYRVVLMRRDPEEIRQSYEAFFGKPLNHPWLGQYEQRMDRAERMLANRRDVKSVVVIDYRSAVEYPFHTFGVLASEDWPMDLDKAAAAVDPAQCRFKKELLTVGT